MDRIAYKQSETLATIEKYSKNVNWHIESMEASIEDQIIEVNRYHREVYGEDGEDEVPYGYGTIHKFEVEDLRKYFGNLRDGILFTCKQSKF